MVQTGQCSNSVGAQNILALIKASPISADLIETGCDGLCFLAPKVIVKYPDRTTSIFNNVSANDIKLITNKINTHEPKNNSKNIASDLLNDQTRIAMDQCGYIDPVNVKSYISIGGYQGLSKVLDKKKDEVIKFSSIVIISFIDPLYPLLLSTSFIFSGLDRISFIEIIYYL